MDRKRPKSPITASVDAVKRHHHHTRRTPWNEATAKEPVPGSYAHVDMQRQFAIDLPAADDDELSVTENGAVSCKRKVAMLVAYLGSNYAGFQINPGQRTIQAELELALIKAKLLLKSNFGYPSKYNYSTSGRTDKGVHACGQVCSLKIELLPAQTLDAARQALNAQLPADIVVLDIIRTTRSFCAHTVRDRVRYQYLVPSFLLASGHEVRQLFGSVANKESILTDDGLSLEDVAEVRPHLRGYRASPEQLGRLQQAVQAYQGTHSFHNFTRSIQSTEARAKRFIVSFVTEAPMIISGLEWIPTQVLGQSFLIHQIRKMINLAIDVARGAAPRDVIPRALNPDTRMFLNVAPPQGLFLEMSYYTNYNERKRQQTPDLPDLNWTADELSPVFQRWKEFRNDRIMKHVVAEEEAEGNFIKHLSTQEYLFDSRKKYALDNEPAPEI